MKKVVVIGAGASGLCCARHLSKFPDKFQFKVYEQGDQVGGTWVYSNPTPGQLPRDVRDIDAQSGVIYSTENYSSMYKNLRTNLPKEIMQFIDFPFDDHLPSFPYHQDVLKYLERYCEHYNLSKYIDFRRQIEHVIPITSHYTFTEDPNHNHCLESKQAGLVRWRVTIASMTTGEKYSEECDFVIICNGHYFVPHTPEVKGLKSFTGTVVHSHLYKEPEPFADQSVLIVGIGPSGQDISLDLAPYAKDVYMCNRKDPLVSKLPDNIQDLPGIVEIKSDSIVCFQDGRERYVDSIILATGYLYSCPFLTEESGINVVNGNKRITPLYKHTFNAVHPSIAVVGVNIGLLPFPAFDLQANWVVSVWRGDKQLPDTEVMLKDTEETYQCRLREGVPYHKAGHYLGSTQWDLFKTLAALGGMKPLDSVIQKLYEATHQSKMYHLVDYKNVKYKVTDRDNFCVIEK